MVSVFIVKDRLAAAELSANSGIVSNRTDLKRESPSNQLS
jgi:hypothetical protein